MNDENIEMDKLSSHDDLAAVEDFIANAAAATDEGDYRCALYKFEQAIEATQRIFGDNNELTKLERNIADMRELLDEQDSVQ